MSAAPTVKPTMNREEITPTCRYSDPKCVSYEYIRTMTVAMPTQPVEKTRKELSKLDSCGPRRCVARAHPRNPTKTTIGTYAPTSASGRKNAATPGNAAM
jgi:hypothetical protein